MPLVATADTFLAIARKSNQIDVARIDSFLLNRKDLPDEPRKLAALLIRSGLMTAFQAEQFLLGKHKGFTIGGYRVLDRLGSGGASTVYLAEHEMMRRRAAIKVLPTPLAEDPATVERFRIEAQAAAALDHPNVVRLYDFGKDGRLYYLVLEYVDGPTLQQVIARKGGLTFTLAAEYVRQAALGLEHAHDAGLVHRDVKPANILLDSSGTVKVLDLGLALMYQDEGASVTRQLNSGAVLGTADYLAPEQALDLHEVDVRADVYSLGATLFALLIGRPPFDGRTIGQKLMYHQTRIPDRVDRIRPEIPAELADVVARMLSKSREDRQQSMREVALALAPWADAAPSLESRSSTRLGSESRAGNSLTGRLPGLPDKLLGKPVPDTWVNSAAEVDTGRIDLCARLASEEAIDSEEPAQTSDQNLGRNLLILGGVIGLLSGLVGGIVAFLLWGPRS